MKKILLVLISMLLFSCNQPVEYIEVEKQVVKEVEIEKIIEVQAEKSKVEKDDILFALYDGETLSYYDGENFIPSYFGKISYAGNGILSVEDILYYMDSKGEEVKTFQLSEAPDKLFINKKETNSRAVVYEDDIWTLITIDPIDAYNQGAMYKAYTKILMNNIEQGNWYLNEWETDVITKVSTGEIIVKDTMGAYHNISGETIPFKIYGDLYIHDVDYLNRTAHMSTEYGTEIISYNTNNFITGRWQRVDDRWYSHNGNVYVFGGGIYESNTAMYEYINLRHENNERYSLQPAGERSENSEMVSYWIDSTSGDLFKHIPSIDRIDRVKNIYLSTGIYSSGNTLFKTIKPQWIDDKLYFHHDNSVKYYDPVIGGVTVLSDDGEVFVW